MSLSRIFDDLGEKFSALTEEVEKDAYRRGVLLSVRLLQKVRESTDAELRLQGGEMTAQELRTLRAWLGALAAVLHESVDPPKSRTA